MDKFDKEFEYDLDGLEDLNLDTEDFEVVEACAEEACSHCDQGCGMDDPYKIQEKSAKLYAELEAKYTDEEEFMVNVQKEVTRMILDVVDEACATNTTITDLTKQYREEFFVDGPIDFNKTLLIAQNLVKNLFIVKPHPSVAGTAMMLPEALEGQKTYGIFEFK